MKGRYQSLTALESLATIDCFAIKKRRLTSSVTHSFFGFSLSPTIDRSRQFQTEIPQVEGSVTPVHISLRSKGGRVGESESPRVRETGRLRVIGERGLSNQFLFFCPSPRSLRENSPSETPLLESRILNLESSNRD